MSESVDGSFSGRQTTKIINDIAKRRSNAGKLVAGVSAPSSSDMFKGQQDGKVKAKRWDDYLSEESLRRKPSSIKQNARLIQIPGMVSLGAGLPSSESFPFAEITIKIPAVPNFSEASTQEAGILKTIGKYDVKAGTAEYDLSIALNYAQVNGSAQLLRFLTEHTEIICQPPYADWGVSLTIGNTGALDTALRMLCDKSRGDAILTEEFSFSTALETMEPLGLGVFGTAIDGEGIIPEAMDKLLSNWDAATRGFRKPHVLYTVPSGHNPTGATQSAERRRSVYAVAQKHNIFILEDEPYYFLQLDQPNQKISLASTIDEFVNCLAPTYVSLDTDGRVMRLDSFSKVLAPGSRLGWVVGSQQIIENYQRLSEVASQGANGFSQVIFHRLLESWGHEGYLRWLMKVRVEYTHKRDSLLAACDRHLPKELVSWTPPAAGMFIWLVIDHAKHPNHGERSLEELEQEIFDACVESGVLLARGSWFRAEKHSPLPRLCFRASFGIASRDSMDLAISRFGKALRNSFESWSMQ